MRPPPPPTGHWTWSPTTPVLEVEEVVSQTTDCCRTRTPCCRRCHWLYPSKGRHRYHLRAGRHADPVAVLLREQHQQRTSSCPAVGKRWRHQRDQPVAAPVQRCCGRDDAKRTAAAAGRWRTRKHTVSEAGLGRADGQLEPGHASYGFAVLKATVGWMSTRDY